MKRKLHSRTGFTLVEMLVVIAIIGILAAILVPVVFYVLAKATDTRMLLETNALSEAFLEYQIDNKEFPPNFNDANAVNRHLRLAFPRYVPTATGIQAPPTGLTPSEALVFWLRGFGPNPVNPLDPNATRKVYFEFDETRLVDTDGNNYFEYYPQSGQKAPYVYLHNSSYSTITAFTPAGFSGTAIAYRSSTGGGSTYANPDTYQILCAGQDGHYGGSSNAKQFPLGTNYEAGDYDNITNFSEGTLQSKQE